MTQNKLAVKELTEKLTFKTSSEAGSAGVFWSLEASTSRIKILVAISFAYDPSGHRMSTAKGTKHRVRFAVPSCSVKYFLGV